MKIAVISNAPIVERNQKKYLYAPYLIELRLWGKHVDAIQFCCPVWRHNTNLLVDEIKAEDFDFSINEIKDFNATNIFNIFKTIVSLPYLVYVIAKTMYNADHIHLRCPGNVGLLACLVQIVFPNKPKTAKYAGNWDPNSKQPWSYRLQKWILNNTFLTKNMQVLVYGNWEGASKNIKPFFTATYTDQDAQVSLSLPQKALEQNNPIKFIFVGTLSLGKRPLYALQLWHKMAKNYPNAILEFYGEGVLRKELEAYIDKQELQNKVILKGNQTKQVVEQAYKESHFLILASQSEGWPKVVAEAMFWGCVPLSTNVSCVYEMMGYGTRGVLLDVNLDEDVKRVLEIINSEETYYKMSHQGKQWSTAYTLDTFDKEIAILLKK